MTDSEQSLQSAAAVEPQTALSVSVVIPTFNGADRLPAVFEALLQQDCADGVFELIVVENASTDDTAEVATSHPLIGKLQHRGVKCRVVHEPRQGATYARIKGVQTAQSDLVCFLDDDNLPENNFISAGLETMSEASIGLAVSRVTADWQVAPPASLLRRRWLFGDNTFLGESRIDFQSHGSMAPIITAGLWVRRAAFIRSIPCDNPGILMADRRGKSMACGGDVEFGILLGKAGFGRIYAPQLRVRNRIPLHRLRMREACRLVIGIVRSELTVSKKYGFCSFAAKEQASRCMRLIAVAAIAPLILLTRKDGLREVGLILADRWARMLGPYTVS